VKETRDIILRCENYFVKIHQSATNISFCTFHIYGRPTLTENDLKKVLDRLIRDAHKTLNKPIVMEEYGIPKGKCDEVWTREDWYQLMLDEFYSKEGMEQHSGSLLQETT